MVPRTLVIRQRMPNLNDVIEKCKTHWSSYGVFKKKWAQTVTLYAREQQFPAIAEPAFFEFEFGEPNRRRDPDNFTGGAQKIIFDALQDAGLLKNDGWEQVLGISHTWRVVDTQAFVRLTVR